MRVIIFAIIGALKAAFSFGVALVFSPLRWLFGFGGRFAGEPALEIAPPLETPPEPVVDHTETYRRTAIALQTWAAESLMADALQPSPEAWPRSVRKWARGLSREECLTIIDAPEHAVIGHISGVFAMPGVRALQPMKASPWQRQEPLDPCRSSAGFAAPVSKAAREPQ